MFRKSKSVANAIAVADAALSAKRGIHTYNVLCKYITSSAEKQDFFTIFQKGCGLMDHIIVSAQKSRKDIFHASLVCGAKYAGSYEMPCIKGSSTVPPKLLPFDKAIPSNEYNSWIHFYIHDYEFERI